jgi:galactose mutarotase-like enzyme
MIKLENEFIRAVFSPKGAELQQLISLETNENYLWNGDAKFWGKFSPVLFPIVGGLKENTYHYDNQEYNLTRHGFARDKEFNLELENKDELLFVLSDSPETLSIYPFKFKLGIRYELKDSSLICTYEISNTDSKEIFFSIGGHPAFAIKTTTELTYSDYYLQFNNDEVITYHEIENDLISDHTNSLDLTEGKLHLDHELFYNDALVFKTLKSDAISIRNTKNSNKLEFKFTDFPYFGIWAAKDADFVCLEPWCGIADVVGQDQNLERKEGIVKLASNAKFTRSWNVTIS